MLRNCILIVNLLYSTLRKSATPSTNECDVAQLPEPQAVVASSVKAPEQKYEISTQNMAGETAESALDLSDWRLANLP
jgi:hypothetical protein